MTKVLENLLYDRKKIFNIIQKNGPLSKQGIQLLANFKLTTLNRIINDLLSKELIIEDSFGESTGGRKPILYNVNSTKFYILGIDISRTYTQVVITNLRMQILKENRFFADEGYSSKKILHHIVEVIDKLFNELSISKEQVLGIGISLVGPLDREKGIMLIPINFNAENWNEISFKKELEDIYKLPLTIDNGANAAVLAEYYYGSGKGFDNIAYINCGVGIRTGTITSGRIIRTINDREDAFGHMVIDIDGKRCYCGNKGCVESYASIPSIVKEFKGELIRGKLSLLNKSLEEITYLDVFNACSHGDTTSKEVIANAALVFGTALSNYINLLNPQLIILSGPIINNSEFYYMISTETALKKVNSKNASVKFSKGGFFKEYAMAVGAAALVVENSLNQQ
ncbi:ROK family protein [Candidatus Clostridium stratigraminis]|uniref:ROK family protein n=1 Tax=Candidatus Clostridium stratigraminis TaxID=3381661 RepID=A0ABW8T326_9CLOT